MIARPDEQVAPVVCLQREALKLQILDYHRIEDRLDERMLLLLLLHIGQIDDEQSTRGARQMVRIQEGSAGDFGMRRAVRHLKRGETQSHFVVW